MDSKNIINIVIGVLVVVALGLSYFYFTSNKADDSNVVQTGAPSVTINVNPQAQQVIGLLNQLNAVNFNESILNNATYKELQTTIIPIPSEEMGITNPFATANF